MRAMIQRNIERNYRTSLTWRANLEAAAESFGAAAHTCEARTSISVR